MKLRTLFAILFLALSPIIHAADGVLFNVPKQTPFGSGAVITGAQVFFYTAGTSTKQNTYTTAALSVAHSNPVIADADGKLAAIFLDPALGDYKVVITSASDSDPPIAAIDTVDNYPSGLSQSQIALVLFPRTAAEIAAGVTPTNYQHVEGNVKRYGAVGDGTDSTTAFENSILIANASADTNFVISVPPGDYALNSGLTNEIDRDYVWIIGDNAKIRTDAGTVFTWGDGTTIKTGGGLSGVNFITDGTPTAGQKSVLLDGHTDFNMENVRATKIVNLITIGLVGEDPVSATSLHNIRVELYDAAGSIGIDVVNGAGLRMSNITIFGDSSVSRPADRSTAYGLSTTTGIRVGQDTWDTIVAHRIITLYLNIGLDITPATGENVLNGWWNDVVFDFNKTHGIRISDTNNSTNIRSQYFTGGWAVALDDHSVTIEGAGTSSSIAHIKFTNFVARQSGKNNWNWDATNMEHGYMIGCHGLGANRLSANTGTDQDDLNIGADGLTVIGGIFGEDGQTYNGIVGNQGRYGISTAADIDNLKVMNVEGDGGTDGWQVQSFTASKNNVLIHNNTKTGATKANYATSPTGISTPATTVVQTWLKPFLGRIYIYGGTVTEIKRNTVIIATSGPVTLDNLQLGETWSITWSGSPTVLEERIP